MTVAVTLAVAGHYDPQLMGELAIALTVRRFLGWGELGHRSELAIANTMQLFLGWGELGHS
jgi:hypothetical protein